MRLDRLGLVFVVSLLLVVGISCSSDKIEQQAPQAPRAVNTDVQPQAKPSAKGLTYPKTRKSDHVDVLHGTKVADPYRWLEDLDSDETKAWVEAQNAVTYPYLAAIPARKKLRERLTELWNYEKYGIPKAKGGQYFFSKNDGLQNQSVLYTVDSLDGSPRVLLDPNKLSEDGTVALAGYSISHDGSQMAYGVAAAGSDWQEYRIRDVATGEDSADHLKWIKFTGVTWTKAGKGVFYGRFDEPAEGEALSSRNYNHKVYYHKLGTPQASDRLIYERPDQKEWMFEPQVTDDGEYLLLEVSRGTETNNGVFFRSLSAQEGPIVELLSDFDAMYRFIDNDGPVFWFMTDHDAPRGRVIAVDRRDPRPKKWRQVIPEAAETLRGVNLVNNQFVATYLEDAHTVVRIFDIDGRPVREVEMPGLGSASGFGGKRGDKETFYSFTSFNAPSTVYRYDLTTGQSTVFKLPKVDFDPEEYVTKQVFFSSKDGTRVPMFITHKKGLTLDGSNPTYLYGYGGFDISLTPRFSVSNLVWMEMGGVYVLTNLRGGGEYGKAWHDAGKKLLKQNVFDDFIAAAQWLIAEKYTRPDKLAIAGGSNGGLLVGACMIQRPELFGAALPAVGVMDMLRFHKFTIGHAWTSDYGSPDDPEEFKALYAYSPLHNLKPGTAYPATMVTTADHDDRVVPSHSFKFAATLQAAHTGDAPVLIRIETKAGHGAGKPTSKRIEEAADKLAFLMRTLDLE